MHRFYYQLIYMLVMVKIFRWYLGHFSSSFIHAAVLGFLFLFFKNLQPKFIYTYLGHFSSSFIHAGGFQESVTQVHLYILGSLHQLIYTCWWILICSPSSFIHTWTTSPAHLYMLGNLCHNGNFSSFIHTEITMQQSNSRLTGLIWSSEGHLIL